MKVLILLALVSLAVAQVPWGLDSSNSEEDLAGPFGVIGGDYKTRGLRGLLSAKYGGVRGLNNIGGPWTRFGQQWGVPNYGPFVKIGNTVVPRHVLQNIINQRNTPYGGIQNQQFGNDLEDQVYLQNLNTPFNTYGNIESQIYGQGLNSPFGDIESQVYGQGIDTPFQYGGINSPVNVLGQNLNQWTQTQGFTPYSTKARLLGLLTRGIGGLVSKTGLNRKLREVCPEVDGGLSYESCITDSHSKHFKCLKDVEDHPRYLQCTHKPVVKKALRDWFVHEKVVHKELIKCLSTTTYADKVKEATRGVPHIQKTLGDLSDEVSTEEDLRQGVVGYNLQTGTNTKKCFYKLQEKVNKCSVLASQCPKFRQCHEHPTIKTLLVKKHAMQAKLVAVLDTCLVAGGNLQDVIPGFQDNVFPEMEIF